MYRSAAAQEMTTILSNISEPSTSVFDPGISIYQSVFRSTHNPRVQVVAVHPSGMGEQEKITLLLAHGERKIEQTNALVYPVFSVKSMRSNQSITEIIQESMERMPMIDAR